MSSRGDEKHRARGLQAQRQGPSESVEVMVSRMVEQRTRPLLLQIQALERRIAQLEQA